MLELLGYMVRNWSQIPEDSRGMFEYGLKHDEDGLIAVGYTHADPGYVLWATEGKPEDNSLVDHTLARRLGFESDKDDARERVHDWAAEHTDVEGARSFIRRTGDHSEDIRDPDAMEESVPYSAVKNSTTRSRIESEFSSVEELAEASDAHLRSITGVGETTLENLRSWLADEGYNVEDPTDPDPDAGDLDIDVEPSGLELSDPATEITGVGDASNLADETVGDFWEMGCPFHEVASAWQESALKDILGASFFQNTQPDHLIRVFAGYTAAYAYDETGEELGNHAEALFGQYDWDRVRWAWADHGLTTDFGEIAAADEVIERQAAVATGDDLPFDVLDFDPEEDHGLSGLHGTRSVEPYYPDNGGVWFDFSADIDNQNNAVYVPKATVELYSLLFNTDFTDPAVADEHVYLVADTSKDDESKQLYLNNDHNDNRYIAVFAHPNADVFGIAEGQIEVRPTDFDLSEPSEYEAWAERVAEQIEERDEAHREEMERTPDSRLEAEGVAPKQQLDDAAGIIPGDERRTEDRAPSPGEIEHFEEQMESIYDPSKDLEAAGQDASDYETVTVQRGAVEKTVPKDANGWTWTDPTGTEPDARDAESKQIGYGTIYAARWERDDEILAIKGRNQNIRVFYWANGTRDSRHTIYGPASFGGAVRTAREILTGERDLSEYQDGTDDADLRDLPEKIGDYRVKIDQRLSRSWRNILDRTTTVNGEEKHLVEHVQVKQNPLSGGAFRAITKVGPPAKQAHTLRVQKELADGTLTEVFDAAKEYMVENSDGEPEDTEITEAPESVAGYTLEVDDGDGGFYEYQGKEGGTPPASMPRNGYQTEVEVMQHRSSGYKWTVRVRYRNGMDKSRTTIRTHNLKGSETDAEAREKNRKKALKTAVEWMEANPAEGATEDGDGLDLMEQDGPAYFVQSTESTPSDINGPYYDRSKAEEVAAELGNSYEVVTAEDKRLDRKPEVNDYLWIDYVGGGGMAGTVTRSEDGEALVRVGEDKTPATYHYTDAEISLPSGEIKGVKRVEIRTDDATEYDASEDENDPTGGYDVPGEDGLQDALAARGINNIVASNLADQFDSLEAVENAVREAEDPSEIHGVGEATAPDVADAFDIETQIDSDSSQSATQVADDYSGDFKNKQMENAYYWAGQARALMEKEVTGLHGEWYIEVKAGTPTIVLSDEWGDDVQEVERILREYDFPEVEVRELDNETRLFIEPSDDRGSHLSYDWQNWENMDGFGWKLDRQGNIWYPDNLLPKTARGRRKKAEREGWSKFDGWKATFPSPEKVVWERTGRAEGEIRAEYDEHNEKWAVELAPTGGSGSPLGSFEAFGDAVDKVRKQIEDEQDGQDGQDGQGGDNIIEEDREQAVQAAREADPDGELPGQAKRALKQAWAGYKHGIKEGREAAEAVEQYREEYRDQARRYAAVINDIREAYGQEPIDFEGVEHIPEVEEVAGPITEENTGDSLLSFDWSADPYDPSQEV